MSSTMLRNKCPLTVQSGALRVERGRVIAEPASMSSDGLPWQSDDRVNAI